LSDRIPDESMAISISEKDSQVLTPLGALCFDETDIVDNQQAHIIFVDKDSLQFPLILRRKQEGDVFYPWGMAGKKKLSKYFKDEKLSLLEKEQTWVLCSDDAIVWVLNRRADNRFKVTGNTKHILRIKLE
jgi:tRNA(Ile)-lysidine synthase